MQFAYEPHQHQSPLLFDDVTRFHDLMGILNETFDNAEIWTKPYGVHQYRRMPQKLVTLATVPSKSCYLI